MGMLPRSLDLQEFVRRGEGKGCCGQLEEEKLGKGFTAGMNGKLHNGLCASKLYLKKKNI